MNNNEIPTQSERAWAAVAHASAVLTLVIGLSTGGVGALFGLLVPITIYLVFNEKSRFIRFHALQSTAWQGASILGVLLATVVAGAVVALTWITVGILSFVLVGVALIPGAILLSIIAAAIVPVLPVLLTVYSVIASYQAYNGDWFEYRYVGEAVRDRETDVMPEAEAVDAA